MIVLCSGMLSKWSRAILSCCSKGLMAQTNITLAVRVGSFVYLGEGRFWEGGLGWEGHQEGVPTTPQPPPNHPHSHKHLTVPREKGPGWDYVTLVQHEGTDEAREVHVHASYVHT
eukprot:720428-Pelagomonas_calceolata.AAC.5